LPPKTDVRVRLPSGIPSAEGKRESTTDQHFGFRTFGPMEVKEVRCGRGDTCGPSDPLRITFTNVIDSVDFQPSRVTVSPEVPGLDVEVLRDSLYLRGAVRGNAEYTVRISGQLKDIYGQAMGATDERTWRVGPAAPELLAVRKRMQILDPSAKRQRWSVLVRNIAELDMELYRVSPADWPDFVRWYGDRFNRSGSGDPPGQLALRKTIVTGADDDTLTEVEIDLSPAYEGGLGHAVLLLMPTGIDDP